MAPSHLPLTIENLKQVDAIIYDETESTICLFVGGRNVNLSTACPDNKRIIHDIAFVIELLQVVTGRTFRQFGRKYVAQEAVVAQ